MRATPVSRTKLIAACAATAFAILTATAHADPMAAGTWEGKVTGGTLSLGNGKYQNVTVPAGDAFAFTIPAGANAPVAWTAPATHVELPLETDTDNLGTVRTAAGSLDVSSIAGTIDPATGVAHGTATAHGAMRLTRKDQGQPAFSQYCYIGGDVSPAENPAPLLPFALNLGGTGTLTDTAFAANLDCGTLLPLGATGVQNIGDTVMSSGMNSLTLTTSFTHIADPPATNPNTSNNTNTNTQTQTQGTTTTTTTTSTGKAVRCVVPKLKGLKLAKARTAAKHAHCAVGKVNRKKSGKKATTVLKQGAKAGTVLAKGSKIALTVAKK
jgi:hypothetical protein